MRDSPPTFEPRKPEQAEAVLALFACSRHIA
jgi:hypothetical protein